MVRAKVVRFAAFLFMVVALIAATAWPAAAADSKGILVLHTYGADAPGRFVFDAALAQAFRTNTEFRIDLYIETLDPYRFTGEPQARLMREALRRKYADKKIAVVVAVFDSALAFLRDQREPLFPGVPIAALLNRRPESTPEGIAAIWSGNNFGDTVALALKFHPATEQITVIDGAPQSNEIVSAEAQSQIASTGTRIPVSFLRNLPLEELLTRVQALPAQSIIVVARQLLGRGGESISNLDALMEIARVAPAPLYVVSDQLIGLGAVGGIVISLGGQAEQLARLAIRLAGNGSLRVPPEEGVQFAMFDWRQLRRWGISDNLLPPDSDVRFRAVSFWDQYRWYGVAAMTMLAIQSALIAGLLLQRRRRRRAEVALRDSESALRRSHYEVQTLAGRLIAAQEAERARIARELHDDLSQKLALLSIEIDQLVSGAERGDGVRRHAQAAAVRAGDIATGLHELSHELHPARLKILGLRSALQGLCREMSAAHHLPIRFEGGPLPAIIPYEAALCLFRVTQEALRNVVKHSGARDADVRLSHADGMLELRIADSGLGFSPRAPWEGLGLVSMRERVHFLGGQIAMQSTTGQGTRIDVRVPVESPGAAANDRYAGVG